MIRMFRVSVPSSALALIISETILVFSCYILAGYVTLDLEGFRNGFQTVLHLRPDGIELTPPPDLVFAMPQDARGKLYPLLAQFLGLDLDARLRQRAAGKGDGEILEWFPS